MADGSVAFSTLLFASFISLLTIPTFMMSSKELAPTEDQGIIFGILDALG